MKIEQHPHVEQIAFKGVATVQELNHVIAALRHDARSPYNRNIEQNTAALKFANLLEKVVLGG